MSSKTLIYVAGPTGVGKTKTSIALAKAFGTEIISCDSRQFYKEMKIGTAVPTKVELSEVKHHFIQSKSINDRYTVADFEKEAIDTIENIFKEKNTLIMVGGSGMYADAVMFGMDKFPEIPQEIRSQLKVFNESHGIKGLNQLLKERDPKYYNQVDLKNPVRLLRALEVSIASNKPYSSFLGQERRPRSFISKMIILHCPRIILYNKINKRIDQMIESGLENEVRSLIPYKENLALQTFGYKELFPYFEGDYTIEEAIKEVKKNTRRYAKRQITWFKKYENALCFPANSSIDEIYKLLKY
nr:tRNA dimethylallyltransferase [uncultured bacterium]